MNAEDLIALFEHRASQWDDVNFGTSTPAEKEFKEWQRQLIIQAAINDKEDKE
jgi:hypothetical protein